MTRSRRRLLFAAIALLFGTALAVTLLEVTLRTVDVVGRNYQQEVRRYVAAAA